MSQLPQTCPSCHSADVHPRPRLGDWTCHACGHNWKPQAAASPPSKPRLFLSYGRRDAAPRSPKGAERP